MPIIKKGKIVGKGGHGANVGVAGAGADPADVLVTFSRATPTRASTDPFKMGITFTQDTFPSGSQATAVANAKALMVACNWDFINMHNHGFGANGPWKNADKNSGYTYADRASWSGWTSWDARMQLMRDCSGAATKYIITLLPPGWMKMDGGSKTNAASDPLGHGRTWDNLDSDLTIRHTDAHRADMIDLAKAIALRHTDVAFFSIINEQKGNFPGAGYAAEISSDGLSNINNYFEQERYQEGLRTGLDAVGATTVAVLGPYLALDGNGVDDLAVTYAAEGFPVGETNTSLVTGNKYYKYFATQTPFMTRVYTYYEWFLANVSAAARSGYVSTEWKVLGTDNDTRNWAVLYPWRWELFESLLQQMIEFKTLTGMSGQKIIGAETYYRKVTDDLHVPTDLEQGAMSAEMLRLELIQGMHADLRWAPEQGAAKNNRSNLFTSTTDTLVNGGGVANASYYAHKAFADNFRGVNVYDTVSTLPRVVTAVASPTKTLLINHTANPKKVAINGGAVLDLTAFEVRVVTA